MTVLNLYRGDFEKIRRFETAKTKKYCLVGRGVYLTTDVSIANSYRIKGLYGAKARRSLDIQVKAKSRPEAYALAFQEWLIEKAHIDNALRYGRGPDYKTTIDSVWEKKNLKVLQELWTKLMDSGRITSEYRAFVRGATVRDIVVSVKESDEALGHLTKFEFDEDEFMSQMVDVVRFQSPDFWEIVFDSKLELNGFEIDTRSKEDYIRMNKNRYASVRYDEFCNWVSFRRAFKQYGYRGIMYEGGRTLGGRRHSAFCVWDDLWLNEHRVARTKLLKI